MHCLTISHTMVYIRHIWKVFRLNIYWNIIYIQCTPIVSKQIITNEVLGIVMFIVCHGQSRSPTKNWFIWSWPWEICIRLHPCIVSVPRQQTKTSILRAWRQKTVLLQTLSKTGLITWHMYEKSATTNRQY